MTTEADDAVIKRIRKLLSLADNNPNQHEAEAAANKAQELLTEYGISMLAITRKATSRSDSRLGGGLYKWQRELWENVARLNFCMYWNYKGLEKGSKYEHRLLGSEVNVISTRIMAEYLQDTIERMARARVGGNGARFFVKENIEYREGIAATVASRLTHLRWEREEQARKAKASQPTANALTVLDVIDAEKDANDDYLHGEGYSARRRAQMAKIQAEWAAERAAKLKWREDNPAEAAAQDAAEKRASEEWERKNRGKKYKEPRPIYKSQAYFDGLADGHNVSLNQQVDKQNLKRIG